MSAQLQVIEFDRQKLEGLKRTYGWAIGKQLPEFTFSGIAFDTRYAGYLIEKLEMELENGHYN